MSVDTMILLILVDVGLTLVNVAVLGLGVKLYTDQRKQGILSGMRKK